MPRRGFTLVELLVVIGVIAVLASLAIPAIGFAQRKAREAKCRTVIAQVQAGLESLRTSIGTYPEGPPTGRIGQNASSTSQPNNLLTTSWSSGFDKPVSQVDEKHWHVVNENLLRWLTMAGGDNFTYNAKKCDVCGSFVDHLFDPFNVGGVQAVLRYRPARFFRFDGSNVASIPTVDRDDPPGRDSYQIWSCGRDGIDQYGDRNSDDVTSWEKR